MFIFKFDIETLKILKKFVFNKDRVLKMYLFIILVRCNILLILRFSYILDVFSVDTGLLVHCISGWDRTPLYISLLRMSLWADGVIHKSLSAPEMLYLVIAYDWFLFG